MKNENKSSRDVNNFAHSVKAMLVNTEGEAEPKVATKVFSDVQEKKIGCRDEECGHGKCTPPNKERKRNQKYCQCDLN